MALSLRRTPQSYVSYSPLTSHDRATQVVIGHLDDSVEFIGENTSSETEDPGHIRKRPKETGNRQQ